MKEPFSKKFIFLLALVVCASGYSQQRITGTVSDADGVPLPGANVVIKGTTNGTTADFDGNYAIDDVQSGATLVFSYIGYTTREIPVNGQSIVNASLQEDLENLDEVIVVAYGTTTKKDLTGAVGVVSGEDLAKFPTSTIDQALQGRTAGVQIVSNSGAPGASVAINIRGTGTFTTSTPLYVVDGYPTQDISFLNPNNIQSISVLKDASAGAIYGVRASNGVVIIETKKGTSGRVTFEVDTWSGFRFEPKFLDVLDVQTFADFAVGLSQENNGPDEPNEQLTPYPGWSDPSSLTNVNWQDFAFNSGFRTSTNITARGGGENSRFSFTAGLIDEDGVVVGSSYRRYNAGLNGQFDVTDKFRVKGDIKYAYTESVTKLNQGYYNIVKLLGNVPHLADADAVNMQGGTNGTNLPYDGNGNYGGYPDIALQTFRGSENVIGRALQNDQENGNTNVFVNLGLEYDIVDGLMAKLNLGGNSNTFYAQDFFPEYYRSSVAVDLRGDAIFDVQTNYSNEFLGEALLEYKKEFGKHSVSILGGISAQRNYFKRVRTRAAGFLNNEIRDISQASDVQALEGYRTRRTLASQFGRLNYNFNSKYYATATIRRDGVGDTFGPNNLWGVFPSFAAGWNIDEEGFMDNSVFDVLKLRGSWGETGSFFGIDPFQFAVFYSAGNANNDANYDFGGTTSPGLYPLVLPNPDLKWEAQIQTNVGLEAELFNRSLYLTADWFKREASDFLFREPIPIQNGFGFRAVNSGSVVNKGVELLVGHRKSHGDFTWDISANVTFLDNEITELTSQQDFVVLNSEFVPSFSTANFWFGLTRSEVGGEVGSYYAFRADGLFQTQEEVDAVNASAQAAGFDFYQSEDTSPGDRRFKDLNGDGRVDGDDREIIGSPIPDFFGGLNMNFSYKNWDIGIDLYGSYGSEIMNFVRLELETAGGYGLGDAFTNIGREYYEKRWTGPGTTNTYARAIGNDSQIQNGRASDYFMEDGSFLRLRNLRVGYNLPTTLIETLGMSSARVYLSGQNLITLTGYSGYDPEVGQNADINGVNNVQTRGIDAGQYPISPSFTVGVNVQF
jgi:TonB-linked SusC/RagA family outer membrane protein